jgi:hypothetical protein
MAKLVEDEKFRTFDTKGVCQNWWAYNSCKNDYG